MSEEKKQLHNPYEVLGIEKTALQAEIKDAYRRKAQALHPDKNPSPEAAAQFNLVQKAYELLSDENRRAQFDKHGRVKPSDEEYDRMSSDALNTNLHAMCDRITANEGDQQLAWGGVSIPNPLQLLRAEFDAEVGNRKELIATSNKKIKSIKRVIRRFKHKNGFEQTPLFGMLNSSIDQLERSIFDADIAIEVFKRMTAMLTNYEYSSAFYPDAEEVGVNNGSEKLSLGFTS